MFYQMDVPSFSLLSFIFYKYYFSETMRIPGQKITPGFIMKNIKT